MRSALLVKIFTSNYFALIVAPNYTNVPADQEVNKTSSLALNFQLEAQGDNFTYNWTKNGVQFISNINVTVTAASISITSADCSDNGLYSVTATNHLGSDSVSFRLVVLCKLRIYNSNYDYLLNLYSKVLQYLKLVAALEGSM